MIIIVAALADTIEITATTYQLHLVRELVGKTLLHIEGLSTIDMEDVGFCIERTGELNLIRCGALDAGLRIPFSGIEAEASTVAPLLVEVVVAGIDIGSPRFAVFTGDDVDNSSYGIGAIERRSCTLYYLDTSYIIQVQTTIIYIIHGFASQSLAIYEEEHGVSTETIHIERSLLIHGIAELQTRHLLGEEVLDIGSICYLDIIDGNQTGYHRSILQSLRSSGCGNYHLIKGSSIRLKAKHMLLTFSLIRFQYESLSLIAHKAHLHSHRSILAVRNAEISVFISCYPTLCMQNLDGSTRQRCARIIEHPTHDIALGFGFQIQAQSAKDQE